MKRTQIQIAVDALKKQLKKYRDEHGKAFEAEQEAQKSMKFFTGEIERLEGQIKQLEGTSNGAPV